MDRKPFNTSQTSLSSLISNEEDKWFGNNYSHDDLTDFLSKSSIKELFSFACKTTEAKPLFYRFNKVLSCELLLNVNQLGDLYTLAIIMMSYQEENQHVVPERLKFVEVIGNLTDHLDLEELNYIAYSLYDKFVNGIEHMESVISLLASIPALIRASDSACDVAVCLLLIIMAKYTKVPLKLKKMRAEHAKNAFEMAKLVNWQHLVESNLHLEMFMLIKTFGLIINCRRVREECPDSLGIEIHKYFLQVRKTIDNSSIYGEFEMMVERYIAYCVVRGAALTSSNSCSN